MSVPANQMVNMPPGTDPLAYAKALRQQQISDAMLQTSLAPSNLQQPQGSNRGFYQAAKVSPLSGLSKLAEAVMAKRGLDQSNQTMAQMYARGLSAFQPGGGPAPAQQPQGQDSSAAAAQAPPGIAAPTQTAPTSQTISPTGGGSNPLNPLGMPANVLYRLYQTDPAKYLDAIKGTPEWQTAVAANGGNVTAAEASLKAKMTKDSAIANRSGEENMIPTGHMNPDGTPQYQFIRTPNVGTNQDYTRNPDGSIAETHLIPGAVEAEATQKGAETAATQANTPREVPIGGGRTALMYPNQVPTLGPAPGAAGATPAGPAAPQAPQQPRRYFPQTPSSPASGAGAAAPQPNAPSPIPSKGQDGVTFDSNLWSNIPKMSIPTTPGQTTDSYTQTILDSAAKKHQELVDKFGEGSAQATLSNNYLNQALTDLPKAETGPMSEWLTENRGKLVEMFPTLAPALSGDKVTPTLELNKALVNSGLQGAKANFGRLTQSEVMLQKDEMSPSAVMTHDAIAALIHQQQIKNGFAIQTDKDYSEYHAAGGDPNRFESQYNVRRPITRFAAQYDTPPAALDRLKQSPQLLPDFQKKYGWNPTQ